MCKKCWSKIKDYHKTSTERLLKRWEHRIAFNLTSSRWGFASVLSTIFSFFIAFAIGTLALGFSIYAIKGNIMTWYIWVIVGFAIFIGLAGLAGLSLVIWISLHFLRVPLTTESSTIENINKAVSEDIPQELKSINTSIQEVGNKIEAKWQREQEG